MSGADVMPLPPDTRQATDDLIQDLDTLGKRIADTLVAKDAGQVIAGWEGQAKDAHTAEVRKLGQHARNLSGEIPDMSKALKDWRDAVETSIKTKVPDLWVRYDDAQTTYNEAYDTLVTDIETNRAAGTPLTQAYIDSRHQGMLSTRNTAQQGALDDYDVEMDRVDDAAATAARELQKVIDGIVPPEAVAQGRSAVAATLFDDMPTVDGVNEWNLAQEEAPDAAAQIRQLAQGADPDQIREFYDRYGARLGDPFFARALGEEISPEEMMRYSQFLDAYLGPQGTSNDPDLDELIFNTRAALGESVVLASGGHTNDPALMEREMAFRAAEAGLRTNDGQSLAESTADFNAELTRIGRTIYGVDGQPITDPDRQAPGYGGVAGYHLLGDMLNEAGKKDANIALGAPFLEDVAPDMIAWDKEMLPYHDYGGILGYPSRAGADFDQVDVLMRLLDEPDGLPDVAPGSEDYEKLSDTEKALLQSEAERMDGVRDFLTSDTSFDVDPETDGDQRMNMTRYLTSGRVTDLYTGTDDGGEALGEVLAQATAVPDRPADAPFGSVPGPIDPDTAHIGPELREWLDDQAQSAEIAANFLAGYQDGLDSEHGDLYRGESQFGSTHWALRSWAGVVLAPHMEGIVESLHRPDEDPLRITESGFGNDESIIKFDANLRDRLLNAERGMFVDLAFDQPLKSDNGTPDDPSDDYYFGGRLPATQNLMLAAQSGYQEEAAFYLAEGNVELMDTAAGRWGSVTEALLTAPESADKNVQEAIAEQNKQLQTVIKNGIGMIPFGDLITNDGVNYLVGQAKGIGLAPTLEALLPTDGASGADAEILDAHNLAENQMRQSFYQVLSTDGDWDQPAAGMSPAEWSSDGNKVSIVDADGNVLPYHTMSREQQASFRDFITAYEAQGAVYGPRIDAIDASLNDARLEREES